jgi:trimethylamine--corrinoid protein Co-methyltransferase
MARGHMTYGAPETQLMFAGYAEVAQTYGLPTWGLAGATDSKTPDAQAGIDATFSLLIQTLAGLNIIHDIGYLDSGMVCSAEMLVMGNEICGMVKRFVRGVKIDADTLATEVIDAVGHGGHFLQSPHTLKHFRSEMWHSRLLVREPYDVWQGKGAKEMEARVKERLDEIMETHKPKTLNDKIVAQLAELRRQGAGLTRRER